jgi:RNA polymerase sigma factor (sigma-70 family)
MFTAAANEAVLPRFISHPSFTSPQAKRLYGPATDPPEAADGGMSAQHLPDEITRDLAQRMHFAAFQIQEAAGGAAAERWRQRYFVLRDRVILGNRKLVYRAVRRRIYESNQADDLIGECFLVMIRAVAAYNPWLGIRFSTYAFTCLMRALSRLGGRLAADRLMQALSLEALPDYHLADELDDEEAEGNRRWGPLAAYLQEANPLLSTREKVVLERRYQLTGQGEAATLERVGRDLGISKERVRQLQASALDKLRQALNVPAAQATG